MRTKRLIDADKLIDTLEGFGILSPFLRFIIERQQTAQDER